MEESEIDSSGSKVLRVPVEPERILEFARFAAGGMLLVSAGLAIVFIRLTTGWEWFLIPVGLEVLLAVAVFRLRPNGNLWLQARLLQRLGYVPALAPFCVAPLRVLFGIVSAGWNLWSSAFTVLFCSFLLTGVIHLPGRLAGGWTAQIWLFRAGVGRVRMTGTGLLVAAIGGFYLILACDISPARRFQEWILPFILGVSAFVTGICALPRGEGEARLGLALLRSIAWGFPVFYLILLAGDKWENGLVFVQNAAWFLAAWICCLACVVLVASGRLCRLILSAQERVAAGEDSRADLRPFAGGSPERVSGLDD